MASRNTVLALVAIVCTGLVACTSSSGPDDKQKSTKLTNGQEDGAEEAVPVEVVTLQKGEIEAVLRFSANLEAESQVQVLARAPGLITGLLVEEGDTVQRGQVLMRLEDEEQRIKLAQAENDLARAEREYQQQKALHQKGVSSEQNLATAKFELQRLKLMRREAGRALRYTTVRAPITGTITARAITLGQTVNLSQPLFDITDFDTLVARIFVPEKELARLRPQLRARILARAAEFEGEVARVAPAVDPQSGTVKATIAVPRHPQLLPGMFVEVALVVERRPSAVLLPKRALVYDNEVPYAFKIVDGDRAARIRIESALENRDFIEPARDFEAGDQVVIAGQIGLKNNAKVEPTVRDARRADAGVRRPDTQSGDDQGINSGDAKQ